MMYKIKRIKKGITITSVALAILSTLIAVILLLGKGSNTAVVAHAADETGELKFVGDVGFTRLSDTDHPGQLKFDYYIGANALKVAKWDESALILYQDGTLRLFRSETEPNLQSYKDINWNTWLKNSINISPPKAAGNYSIYWTGAAPEYGKTYYYYIGVGVRQQEYAFGIKKKDVVKVKYWSLTYIQTSYKEKALEILENETSDMDDEELKYFRTYAELETENEDFEVTLKYKETKAINNASLKTVSETYRINNLRSQDKDYVISETLKNAGKSNISDFNVIHIENAVGKDEDGNDKGYLLDNYVLLQAKDYEYTFDAETNSGEINVLYHDFQAKDLAITITSDKDDLVATLRSPDISTDVWGTTTYTKIVFDTSNLQKRLSNCFGWDVSETAFDNYYIDNPYNEQQVKIMESQRYDSNGNKRVVALVVYASDENYLADVCIRLTVATRSVIDYTLRLKYVEIGEENGDITVTDRTEVIEGAKVKSNLFNKITAENVLSGYTKSDSDGNVLAYIPAQREIIEAALECEALSGLDYYKIADVKTYYSYEAATGFFEIVYAKNNLFKITNSATDEVYFKSDYKQTSLTYSGSELIDVPDGYRISNITSENTSLATIRTGERKDDWLNGTIQLNVQRGQGVIIPLTVTLTDRWNVTFRWLERYKKTPFATDQEYTQEVLTSQVSDIYKMTADKMKEILVLDTLNVLSSTVANIEVTFDGISTYTVTPQYTFVSLMQIDYNGDRQEVRVPLTTYAESREIAGINWSIMTLNRSDGTAKYFNYPNDVAEDKLYGYFAVVTFKEHISDINYVFRNDTGDGLKVLYKSKKITGSDFYKWNMSKKGTFFGGVASILAGIGEIVNDKNALYESYFFYMDNGSGFISNGGATSADDTDSSLKNFGQRLKKDIEDFFSDLWSKLTGNKKLMFAFWLVIGILLYAGMTWLFTYMGLMNGFFKYLWIAVAFVGVIIALYFGITIFA